MNHKNHHFNATTSIERISISESNIKCVTTARSFTWMPISDLAFDSPECEPSKDV